ncbi:unnamed protein product [Pedinophyceae sp. YPF-701]|nr:unnamed protein product [Pedinophyceae sp. YPF-701]
MPSKRWIWDSTATQIPCVHEAHNGSFAAADAMFAELLDLSPRNVRSLHAWAELHRKRGRTARAEELYREALRVDPDHGQSLASLAKLLVDTGTSASARDDARDLLRRALDARPSDTVALQALARLEWAAGNRRAARQIYARIAMLGPAGGDGDGAGGQKDADARGSHAATPSLLSGWGGLEQSRRHSARAARLYEAALQRDPEHLPSLMGLGVVESKAGNHAAAEAHYRRALEVSPGNVRIRCALAQGLRAAGRTAEARRELDGVLEDDPGCARAWYILGVLLQQIGEAGDAREAFKRGAGTGGRDGKPRDATSLLLCFEAWAEGEAGQGRTALAVRLFEEGCIAIAPQEPTARYLRAWALAAKREGDLEGALELLARAARADPHDYRIWLLRAVLQRRSGGVSAARSDYARAAAARPREPAVWLSWSQLERAAGDDARARELLVRGVQRCPGCNPQLLTEIALMDIERGGNVDPARRMLAVASHVQPGAGRGTAQATRQPHVPALTAWHAMEVQRGNAVLAARLEELETAALTGGPRAARHVVQELAQLAATEVGASPESVLRELHRRALGAAAEEDDGGVDDGWQAGLLSSIGGVEDEEGGGVDEGAVRP